jgi:uncharacterized membrane protein SpoIIM required for sporulation
LAPLSVGYVVLLVTAVAGGGAVAAWREQALAPPHHGATPTEGAVFLVRVLESNALVWAYTCAGLVSFGAAGLFVLAGNAFRFGMDAMSMARGAPRELVYLLPHAVLEFAAFTLAAASCQYLAWCVFDVLVLNRPRVPAEPGLRMLAVSFVLLVIAACVETCSWAVRFGT